MASKRTVVPFPTGADITAQEKGRRAERKVAQSLRTRVHPASGAGRIKADMSNSEEVIEMKHVARSHTVKLATLLSTLQQAQKDGKQARYVVHFTDGDITLDAHIRRGKP